MGEALIRLGAVPQDWAPTQAGSRVTGGVVVDGLGDGAVVVGVALAGALVAGPRWWLETRCRGRRPGRPGWSGNQSGPRWSAAPIRRTASDHKLARAR